MSRIPQARQLEPWNLAAGDLRHRVTIEKKDLQAVDSRGKPVRDWQPAFDCWAKVEPLAGRKGEIARQLVPSATHLVTVRYRDGISVKTNRVNYGGRILAIGAAVDVQERHVKLELTCTEASQ